MWCALLLAASLGQASLGPASLGQASMASPEVRPSASLFVVPLASQLSSPLMSAAALPALPQRYAWVAEDSRALWYAAGASAAVATVSHLVIGLPVLALSSPGITALALVNPVAALSLVMGVVVVYLVVEAALAAAASTFVFDGASRAYESSFLSSFWAHVLGNVVGTVPAGMLLGAGWLALSGIRQLAAFGGTGAYSTTVVLTILGAMPVALIGFGALVAIPALMGAWTTGTVARPKVGFALDGHWADENAPKLVPTGPATTPSVQPLLTVPLPG